MTNYDAVRLAGKRKESEVDGKKSRKRQQTEQGEVEIRTKCMLKILKLFLRQKP